VATGERIDCADPAAADDFEAITFSLYQEAQRGAGRDSARLRKDRSRVRT
jgi:hypothetical protein